VALTASQLKADADNIVDTMGLRADWPNLGVISLAHSYGFSNLVLPLLLHGIPLVLVPSGLPEIIRAAAGKERAVTIPAVPALWRTWFEAEAIPRNTKLAISAGAPLTLDLEQKIFARDGLKIHNFYGSSECGGIAYDATQVPRSESACVGSPMRNVEVRVGSGGCIEVLGAAVAETYWPEPGPALNGGVFRTSDLGEVKDGLVFLHGRVSDQINVAGRKVAPEIIERALATHPQVRACLAFGIPADARRGESIVACIAASEALTETALRQYALSRLPAWQVPRHWWFIDELEANERGKISRAEWRRRYLERASPSR
jgi:acyl-CoA synthetase (AMP-forming)/AMP-acid ligase II